MKKFNSKWSSIIITASAVIYLVAVSTLIFDYGEIFRDKKKEYELKAWSNINKIISAQEKYIQTDWDKDGVLSFALFTPHLWISIGLKNDQIPVNLIEPELAMSMSRIEPYNGYVYKMIHKKTKADGSNENIDYSKEWAVIAFPVYEGHERGVVFISDKTGKVLARSDYHEISSFPSENEKDSWINVKTEKDLIELKSK